MKLAFRTAALLAALSIPAVLAQGTVTFTLTTANGDSEIYQVTAKSGPTECLDRPFGATTVTDIVDIEVVGRSAPGLDILCLFWSDVGCTGSIYRPPSGPDDFSRTFVVGSWECYVRQGTLIE
ncbi:uncharacterized protein DSM5745_08860 [Aspergillus mulundensis]|uniref:Uncharacterized protein n=1 Tax=Aspergillus mulundensis TaxID=1810919 RepID=A0A3D8R557_9EURO|nr:hypothetical protein DSM5745_08860 [Aspergillus mulundensis]RDW69100.1 hypothetical protein DSM5745_08860 [Aspergillus mulundensis]